MKVITGLPLSPPPSTSESEGFHTRNMEVSGTLPLGRGSLLSKTSPAVLDMAPRTASSLPKFPLFLIYFGIYRCIQSCSSQAPASILYTGAHDPVSEHVLRSFFELSLQVLHLIKKLEELRSCSGRRTHDCIQPEQSFYLPPVYSHACHSERRS